MLSWLLERSAPDAAAVVDADGSVTTYAELRAAIDAVAAELEDRLGPLDRRGLAVAVPDPAGFLLASLAALRAGAVLVPLDPRAGTEPHEQVLRRVRPAGVVVGCAGPGAVETRRVDAVPRRFANEAALVLPTSGSSGLPKAVLLGEAGLRWNIDAILRYLPVEKHPRTAIVLPLFYSYSLVGQALTTLRAGATALLLGGLRYPAEQVAALIRFRAGGLSSVPTSLRLLAEAVLGEAPPLGYVASAGAPLPAPVLEAARRAFPGARFFNQYGLTEASPRVTAIADDEPPFHAGSVGRPLPGLDVKAIDGELVVSGPSVMLGYLDDPEGTARVMGPRGLRTGDQGFVDAAGYVYVTGRGDDLVKVAGERVGLAGVARRLETAPGVLEAFVAGAPDRRTGTRLVAFVAPAIDVAALRRWAREHLPPPQRPARIVPLGALPRRPNGKLDRAELQRLAEDG